MYIVCSHFLLYHALSVSHYNLTFPRELINDNVAPQFADEITQTSLGSDALRLTWVTNEFVQSTLGYGIVSASYTDSITVSTYLTETEVILENLPPNTTYHGRLTLTDRSDNQGQSAEFTFTLTPLAGKPLVLSDSPGANNAYVYALTGGAP